MNTSGIHQGNLRMYGGFIFKQWKQRFLLLTAEGALHVCHDASSPPEQLVWLQSHCKAIVEGKDILDLPKLPSGGFRDCCFALILPQYKYLLLLADSAADCSQWLNVLKKVKKSLSSPFGSCKQHKVSPLNIGITNLLPEQKLDKDPLAPPAAPSEAETTVAAASPGPTMSASPREKGRNSPRSNYYRGSMSSASCLRHGSLNNAQAMRAVYLLMGGASASSTLGYLGTSSASNLEAQASDSTDFSGLGPAGPYHSGSPAIDSPHFTSFNFEVADAADFDAFDCGGFTF